MISQPFTSADPTSSSPFPRSRPSTAGGADPSKGFLLPWIQRHELLVYTVLAYSISWALLIGGYYGTRVGFLDEDGLPVAVMVQVAAAGPLIAALGLTTLTRGRAGLAFFGRSLIRWRVAPWWYALIFLGIPSIMILAMGWLHPGQIGDALHQNWPRLLVQLPVTVLAVAAFTGLAEEPGWRGYAQRVANRRYQPLAAALVVAVIWALWHLPNVLFGQGLTETLLHLLATTVNGFVLAWAYNATEGSVLVVVLLHGAQNATAQMVLGLLESTGEAPSASEYYLVSALVFGTLMIVVALLTRGRLGTPAVLARGADR